MHRTLGLKSGGKELRFMFSGEKVYSAGYMPGKKMPGTATVGLLSCGKITVEHHTNSERI